MQITHNRIFFFSAMLGTGGLLLAISNTKSAPIYITGISLLLIAGLCSIATMKARARLDQAIWEATERARKVEQNRKRAQLRTELTAMHPTSHWDYVCTGDQWVFVSSTEGQAVVSRSGPIADRVKFGTDDWHGLHETMEFAKQHN